MQNVPWWGLYSLCYSSSAIESVSIQQRGLASEGHARTLMLHDSFTLGGMKVKHVIKWLLLSIWIQSFNREDVFKKGGDINEL